MRKALFIGGSHDGLMQPSPMWMEITLPVKKDPLTVFSILEEAEPTSVKNEVERYILWLTFSEEDVIIYIHSSLAESEALRLLISTYRKGKQ